MGGKEVKLQNDIERLRAILENKVFFDIQSKKHRLVVAVRTDRYFFSLTHVYFMDPL